MISGGEYVSEIAPLPVSERHDVLAGHPVVSAHRALTCRWASGRDAVGCIIFCHGLGSNGGAYAELSRHWARHGYLVIHPTFADSIDVVARVEKLPGLDPGGDLAGWSAIPTVRARMHEILHSPSSWLGRVRLVGAIMDTIAEIVAATVGETRAPLPSAIAGHSFGAYVAQLLAGAEIDLPDGQTGRFRDRRFAAAVLLSAQGRRQQGLREGSWSRMDGPVLTVTGTLDQGAKGGNWRWKSEPYALSPAGAKYLMVLDDGDHFLGGFDAAGRQRRVPAQQAAVQHTTLAFLDAHLRNRDAALEWLGSISSSVAGCPVLFERK